MKLITLGCSFTHQVGWAAYVERCTELPLVNLSQSAGSNQIQQYRFQEYILRERIDGSELVIWQITSTQRKHSRIKTNMVWRIKLGKELFDIDSTKKDYFPTITKKNKNLFDDEARIDFLSSTTQIPSPTDEEQLIEDLLFHLVIAKKFFPNLLVIFGWDRVLPSKYMQKFKDMLTLFNIEYIEDSILEWCKKHHLPMAGTQHPTHRSYQEYGEKVIMPKINDMLDTKFEIIPAWSQ